MKILKFVVIFILLTFYLNAQKVEINDSIYIISLNEVNVEGIRVSSDSPITHSNLLKDDLKTRNLGQDIPLLLNFLPSVAARKYSPAEMAVTYAQAANGGRIGFNQGLLAGPSAAQSMEPSPGLEDAEDRSFKFDSEQFMIDQYNKEGVQPEIIGEGFDGQSFVIRTPNGGSMIISLEDFTTNFGKPPMKAKGIERGADDQPYRYKNGGRIGRAEGGIMDLGGMEKDYRAEGGFVPIGREEKADDVPARLSVNEFVFTADAVRNAGGGDIDQGAKVMENMMKHLEAGGQVAEESQGMACARDMFEVSERLSEVV